uniref:Kinesin motor domain-containing protein n=1 Tax=Falco tinnunculus TaxID=100819 RepID=A0A8C4UKK0_FALTI
MYSARNSPTPASLPVGLAGGDDENDMLPAGFQLCRSDYLEASLYSRAFMRPAEGCVAIEDAQTVILNVPQESSATKNSEKGIGHPVHRFTFSQVFGPETTQSEFFEGSMKEMVRAYVNGVSGLVFTYGVTNAGKTFTIQGTSKDSGILPRSLDVIFNHIRGRHYLKMDFKPYLSNDVKKLEDAQVKQEEAIKTAILASLKEVTLKEYLSMNQIHM